MPKAPKETLSQKQERARKLIKILVKLYPDSQCSLRHENPLQLLVSTMLSAQCTDARVNMTTPALFARYKSAADFAGADIKELETLIKSTGFYKNKAKNIKACGQALLERHGGQVPRTLEELFDLPGVGRKTANVVLGTAFGIPGMVVDTHVTRLSNRLGLVKEKDAVKIEFKLMEIIDKKHWTHLTHLLIDHGRAVCMARSPRCDLCKLSPLCPKLI